MTPIEVLDSIYFMGDEVRLTTSDGKVATTLGAVFSQTAEVLDNGSYHPDQIRSTINELVIAFEHGIKILETLEMGLRHEGR